MKRILLGFLCQFICVMAFAADGKVTLTHLRSGVYYAEDTFYTKENTAVYVGPQHVTVVGATWSPETAKLLAVEIRKVTTKPIKEVIVTDYHLDRSGGIGYFHSIGAKIVTTKQTDQLLRERWAQSVKEFREGAPGYPLIPLTPPDEIHDGDYTLQDGRVRAIYLGPAHTPDGVFVYFPEEKVLYGQCILKEQLGSLESANVTEYPNTLDKLKKLNLGYTTIISGHFSPVHGPELVDQYLRLLDEYSKRKK